MPYFRILIIAGLLALICLSVKAQNSVEKKETPPGDEIYYGLIFDARSQSPEIAADALITIVESGKLKSISLKRQLLEEAFTLALQARHTAKIRYTGATDTALAYRYNALQFNLDKISLQSRALKTLLKIDAPKARQLFFNDVGDLSLTPRGCEETTSYYDVAEYYEIALAIFNTAFTPKERSAPGFFYILNPLIENMRSPAQVDPMAKMLVDLKLTSQQLSLVSVAYTQALAKIDSDDFTFRVAISNSTEIRDLIKSLERATAVSTSELVNAFRAYTLRQLNGSVCSDGVRLNTQNPQISKYLLPGYISSLNRDVLKEKPIDATEIQPEKIVGATPPYFYWNSKKSSEKLNGIRRLLYKSDGTEFTSELKHKPEWRADLDKYLAEFAMWDEGDERTRADFVSQKSILFLGLIEDVAPDGSTREDILKEYALFLNRNELRGDNHLQWIYHIRTLLQMLERLKGANQAQMISVIRNTKNSTMNLYLNLREISSKRAPFSARTSSKGH